MSAYRQLPDMEWKIEFQPGAHFVRITTQGTFSSRGCRELVEELLSNSSWRPGTNTLFDHRNLRFEEASFASIDAAARNHEQEDARIGNGKAAIVMRPGVSYGSGRQYQELTRDRVQLNLNIFLSEQEALDWLAESTAPTVA